MNQLVITSVLKSVNGYTQVFLAAPTFNLISGLNPQIAMLTDGVDEKGNSIRQFDFNGVDLWSEFNPVTHKSVLRIPDADAKRLFKSKPLVSTPYATT